MSRLGRACARPTTRRIDLCRPGTRATAAAGRLFLLLSISDRSRRCAKHRPRAPLRKQYTRAPVPCFDWIIRVYAAGFPRLYPHPKWISLSGAPQAPLSDFHPPAVIS